MHALTKHALSVNAEIQLLFNHHYNPVYLQTVCG